jgi:DNA-binding CsgD family transcriptional regulator
MSLSITYQDHIFNIHHNNEMVHNESIKNLYNQFLQLAGNMYNSFPIFYILDYTRGEYVCLTKSIFFSTGYDSEEFLENEGAERMIDLVHPDDYKVFNQKLFSTTTSFLKKTPQPDHDQYVFSFNFRVICKDKRVTNVWQSATYLTSEKTGMPLYNIGVVLDISSIKKDTFITHTIEKVENAGNRKQKVLVASNFFYPSEEDTLLTRQEKNVLGYISDGLSSKQVAGKLKLSENTIANHRQNMLRKTNTKNVAELVAFSIRSRII